METGGWIFVQPPTSVIAIDGLKKSDSPEGPLKNQSAQWLNGGGITDPEEEEVFLAIGSGGWTEINNRFICYPFREFCSPKLTSNCRKTVHSTRRGEEFFFLLVILPLGLHSSLARAICPGTLITKGELVFIFYENCFV